MSREPPYFEFVPGTLKATKDRYKYGESVYVTFTFRNVGGGTGPATIDMIDANTGNVLRSYGTESVPPGYTWSTPSGGLLVGPMPNHDWRILVRVSEVGIF